MAMRRRQEKWKAIAKDWETAAKNYQEAYQTECGTRDIYRNMFLEAQAELRKEWASRGR